MKGLGRKIVINRGMITRVSVILLIKMIVATILRRKVIKISNMAIKRIDTLLLAEVFGGLGIKKQFDEMEIKNCNISYAMAIFNMAGSLKIVNSKIDHTNIYNEYAGLTRLDIQDSAIIASMINIGEKIYYNQGGYINNPEVSFDRTVFSYTEICIGGAKVLRNQYNYFMEPMFDEISGKKIEESQKACNGLHMVCPESGAFKAYKAVRLKDGSRGIVELLIPEIAKRSSAGSRKCRASEAFVEKITDEKGSAYYEGKVIEEAEPLIYRGGGSMYKLNQKVIPSGWDPNRWEECTRGIHFFMTREEAINYL